MYMWDTCEGWICSSVIWCFTMLGEKLTTVRKVPCSINGCTTTYFYFVEFINDSVSAKYENIFYISLQLFYNCRKWQPV